MMKQYFTQVLARRRAFISITGVIMKEQKEKIVAEIQGHVRCKSALGPEDIGMKNADLMLLGVS